MKRFASMSALGRAASPFAAAARKGLRALPAEVRRSIALGLFLAVSMCSTTSADPAPLRVHIARGLWWEHWRLHEAIARIGGARCDASWDVFGNPQGYSGCGRALSDFPVTDAALQRYDIIVLTGIRAGVLSADAQKRLCGWVEAGGGLLVMGGVHGFGSGGWHGTALEAVLPVEVGETADLMRANPPLAPELTAEAGKALLADASALGLAVGTDPRVVREAEKSGGSGGPALPVGLLAWDSRSRVYYHHTNLTPRPDAQVWATAGGKPLLLGRQVGKGRVVVCAATVCGLPASDQEQLFCEAGNWPDLLATTLNWLIGGVSPGGRHAVAAVASGDPNDPRLAKLAGMGGVDLDGLLDAPPAARKKTAKGGAKDRFDQILQLAVPCGGTLHARAVVKALADSATPFGASEALALDAAIGPHIGGPDFEALAQTLIRSGNSGQVALGLCVLGRLRSPALQPVAAAVLVRGLDALASSSAEPGVGVLRPPDGGTESLKLAAARAVLESGDMRLLDALKGIALPAGSAAGWPVFKTAEGVVDDDGRLSLGEQLAAEALAARAVLGEPEAAPALVRLTIREWLAFEALLDAVQLKPPVEMTPTEAVRRKRQAESLGPRQAFVNRLMDAVARLPPGSYPSLAAWAIEAAQAAKRPAATYPFLAGAVNEGSGEIPMKTLMTALADRRVPLPPPAVDALKKLGEQTVMPEIRALCERRVEGMK